MTAKVDLKWSLWTEDESTWEEYRAKDVLEKVKAAFEGGEQFTVYTAPRKEIRYGSVTVSKGKAVVEFNAVWDSPQSLLPDGLWENDLAVDAVHDWFCNHEGFLDGDPESPVGARVMRTVEAKSFPELLQAVDACEADLLQEEQEAGKELDSFIKGLEVSP